MLVPGAADSGLALCTVEILDKLCQSYSDYYGDTDVHITGNYYVTPREMLCADLCAMLVMLGI